MDSLLLYYLDHCPVPCLYNLKALKGMLVLDVVTVAQ